MVVVGKAMNKEDLSSKVGGLYDGLHIIAQVSLLGTLRNHPRTIATKKMIRWKTQFGTRHTPLLAASQGADELSKEVLCLASHAHG